MPHRTLFRLTSICTLFIGVVACSSGSPSHGPYLGQGGRGAEAGSSPDAASPTPALPRCSSLPKVQGPSEACCPDHGADACGANLFCAAFDGREIATCYVVGSRLPAEECTEDAQCASHTCDATVGKCRGLLGTTCDEEAGCVDSVCHAGRCEMSDGGPATICDRNDDCQPGLSCASGRCGIADGLECDFGGSNRCASRRCDLPEGSNYGTCRACQTDAECQSAHDDQFEVCLNGRCEHTCKDDTHCSRLISVGSSCAYVGSGCAPFTCEGPTASSDGVCR